MTKIATDMHSIYRHTGIDIQTIHALLSLVSLNIVTEINLLSKSSW